MSRIVTVGINDVDPNPWRDGVGKATWKNLASTYPVIPEKLARLQESFLSTEVWEGVIARPAGPRYQLAFGHHRFLAYKDIVRKGKMEDGLFPIIERELGDDDMILFMANENDEEWRHKFLLATMNPVAAVVAAYGEGRIQLEEPVGSKTLEAGPGLLYTATTVAKYLGWVEKASSKPEGIQAADRVLVAVAALDLCKKGVLSKEQFLQLGYKQAKALVKVTRDELKRQQQEFDAEKKVLRDRQELAKKQGDTNTIKKIETKLEGVAKRQEKAPVFKAKSLATKVVDQIERGASTKEALRNVGLEEDKPAPKKKEVEPPTMTLQRARYTSAAERFALQTPEWDTFLQKVRPSRDTDELILALKNAGQRAMNRARELKKRVRQ